MEQKPISSSEISTQSSIPNIDEKAESSINIINIINQKEFHERFNVLNKIGQGISGAIYEAIEIETSKRFAVKVIEKLLRDFDEEEDKEEEEEDERLEQVNSEVRIMKMLEHENCILLEGHYQTNFAHYIVMEYIQGENLNTFLSKKILTPVQRKYMLSQLLSAMSYMHSIGVVHRDIKPENIMIEEESLRLVVIDFGSALESHKLLEPDVEICGAGTIGYVSPETFYLESKNTVSFDDLVISDAYSVGSVFYRMLFNAKLHEGKTKEEKMQSNIESKPKDIYPINGVYEHAEIDILESLLIKNPKNRVSCDIAKSHWYFTEKKENYEMLKKEHTNKNKSNVFGKIKKLLINELF